MACWSKSLLSYHPSSTYFFSSSHSLSPLALSTSRVTEPTHSYLYPLLVKSSKSKPLSKSSSSYKSLICRAAEYKFPDPIPEFADDETEKFRSHLVKKLSKKELYGDSVGEIVQICTEIFNTFMSTEYGGPGTLLVEPFIDMADNLNEKGLPGGPQAARTAVKWAQAHVDNDWKEWTGGN